jgi:23S rRNA pseudouridine1911/1915/1917 synthase
MPEERLDVLLTRQTGLSRSRVQRLIEQGHARVNGQPVDQPSRKVSALDIATLEEPPPTPIAVVPEALPLDILYQDAHLAVVNKPCGMVVHPAAGHAEGTLVNALLHHLGDLSGIGGALRPGIVHRLDKDTSGLLLIAKDDQTHRALSDMLKAREIHKTYQAVAQGHFKEESGCIDAPIGRHPKDRKRMAVLPDGRPATTIWRAVATLRGATHLHIDLITGRTHQIRVHMAHTGHPLLGDPLYGAKKAADAPRLMLHAWRLSLIHPITGENLAFEAPPPDAFAQTIRKLLAI